MLFIAIGCSPSKKELFEITDEFVQSLDSTYESYGAFGGIEYQKTTSDGRYTVFPMGRLINVKIEEYVESDVYEKLRKRLERHYKNDNRVNKVYIN